MASAREWVAGTRPRTLPAAVVPVLIGSGVAAGYGKFSLWRAALALLVALALQIGVNYANDYSDGVRGTDAAGRRAGPMRLVGSGTASPRAVKYAAFSCFFAACCIGLVLAAVTSWWIVAAGALCVLAAWFYTGGSHPYGYRGLGEVSVFVFFGVAAVAGTAFVEMERLSWLGLAASVPAGLLSCALLMVNNLRDIGSDETSGKRTLAVRIGDARARWTYLGFLLVPFLLAALIAVYRPYALLALVAVPLAVEPVRAVRGGVSGPGLIATLGQTGRLQLAFGIAFTVGLAIHLRPADPVVPARNIAGQFAHLPKSVGRMLSVAALAAISRDNLPVNPGWRMPRVPSVIQGHNRPDGFKGRGCWVDHLNADVRQVPGYGATDDEARFLSELRQLRDGAGLGHAELAARAHYPYDSIRAAEVGPDLPDLPVLSAYVKGCGGTTEEWEERWRSLTRSPSLPVPAARHVGHSPAASAGARVGSTALEAEPPDPSVIIAALNRVAEEMASRSGDPLPGPGGAAASSGPPAGGSPAAPAAAVEAMTAVEAATAVEGSPEGDDRPAGWDPIRVSSAWPVLPLSPGDTGRGADASPLPAASWERAPWESAPWAEVAADATGAETAVQAPAAGLADTRFTVESRPAAPPGGAAALPGVSAAQPGPAAALPGATGAMPRVPVARPGTVPGAAGRPAGASRARLLVACAVLLCVVAVALAIFV